MAELKTIRHDDGRCEILRALDVDELDRCSFKDPCSFERSIIWLEDIEKLDKVYQAFVKCCTSRTGPLVLDGLGRIVGYSKLTTNAKPDPDTRCFVRRIFFVNSSGSPPKITNRFIVPSGEIDPRQVAPGSLEAYAESEKRSRFDEV